MATMNLSVILIISVAFLAFSLLVILLGGPSVGKAKARRLSMLKPCTTLSGTCANKDSSTSPRSNSRNERE